MAREIKGGRGGIIRPLEKGQTANPNGRPKGAKYLTELIKNNLDSDAEIVLEGIAQADAVAGQLVKVKVKMPTHTQIIQALLRKAAKGDTKAIDMILDRVEGKVPLPLQGDPDAPLLPVTPAAKLTEKQVDQLIQKL